MDIPIDGKIVWLKAVGKEIDEVASYITKLSAHRKPPFNINLMDKSFD